MKLRFYSMYPEDFECDEKVKRLDLEGLGFFLLCLNYAWTNDGLPPDFGPKLAGSLAKDPRKFARLWREVSPNFPPAADGKFRNPRQELERKKAVTLHNGAVKANQVRWHGPPDGEKAEAKRRSDRTPNTYRYNGAPVFSSSESISTEQVFTSGDDRAREQPPSSPNGNACPQNYPLTARAIREAYPATDTRFLTELVRTAAGAAANIPQPSALEFSDKLLADAVRRCRNDSPTQRSVRLFLTTVPRCISSWIEYGQEQPPPKLNKTDRMLEEIVAEEQAKRLAKEEKTKLAKGATQ
jgi:hypothetical protein